MTSLSRRELLLIFFFWTSLAVLSSVNRLLDPRGFGFHGLSPAVPITLEFAESWLWAALTPFVFWLSSRFSGERPRWILAHSAALLAIGLAISIVVYLVLSVVRAAMFGTSISLLREIGRFRFVNHFLVYLAVLTAGFAREFFLRDQAQKENAARLQAQLADARLDALRMQLNPHFLFNTLHAIAALVERDPGGVRRMIARLSELLRLAMDSDAEHEVTLREELEFLRRYIEIMEIRFRDQLRVSIRADDDTLDERVPRLILQPIVENAFEHANGVVEIDAHKRDGAIVISVVDNGPGVTPDSAEGVGITNTRARLAALYDGAASFTLKTRPEGGALAEIIIG